MEITVQTFSVKKSAVERYGPVQTKKNAGGKPASLMAEFRKKKTSMLPYSMCVFLFISL